jgi:hypothetical protein
VRKRTPRPVHSHRVVLYFLAAALLIVALWFTVFNFTPSRYRCDVRPPPHPCDKDYDIPRRVVIVGGAVRLRLGWRGLLAALDSRRSS